jgi:hypothetical protein
MSAFRRKLPLFVIGASVLIGWTWHRVAPARVARRDAASSERARAIPPAEPAVSAIAKASARANEDFARALHEAERLACTPDERYEQASRLLPDWTMADPRAAWRWALAHDGEWSVSGNPTLTEIVLEQLAATSPESVLLVLAAERWPPAAIIDQAVAALLRRHATTDACALVERWARESPPPDASAAFERATFAVASESPPRAIEWLASLPASAARDASFGTAADVWATTDPAGALAWARSLSEGEVRDAVLERAFGRWVEREAEPALSWLVAHEAEPEADRLIARWLVVSEAVRSNPGAARPWIELIRDPELRSRTAAMVLAE